MGDWLAILESVVQLELSQNEGFLANRLHASHQEHVVKIVCINNVMHTKVCIKQFNLQSCDHDPL